MSSSDLSIHVLNGSGDPIVIDCWGMLDEEVAKSPRVIRLGKNPFIEPDMKFWRELSLQETRIRELER